MDLELERQRLTTFYTALAPDRLVDVDATIERYGKDGPEGIAKMWRLLAKKYNTTVPEYATQKASPQATVPPIAAVPVPANTTADAALERQRLIAFYQQHDEKKLSDVDATIERYAEDGPEGVAKMWRLLAKKYKTEVPPYTTSATAGTPSSAVRSDRASAATSSQQPTTGVDSDLERRRLTDFYRIHAPQKLDEIDTTIDRYAEDGPEGMAKMWRLLAKKYKTEVPPYATQNSAENAAKGRSNSQPSAPTPSAATVDAALERQRLIAFYQQHDEKKLSDVDATIERYAEDGPEGVAKMWRLLAKKYKTEVPPYPNSRNVIPINFISNAADPNDPEVPPPSTVSIPLETRRLVEFYRSHNLENTNAQSLADIEADARATIEKFAAAPPANDRGSEGAGSHSQLGAGGGGGGTDGIAAMWSSLSQRYGKPIPPYRSSDLAEFGLKSTTSHGATAGPPLGGNLTVAVGGGQHVRDFSEGEEEVEEWVTGPTTNVDVDLESQRLVDFYVSVGAQDKLSDVPLNVERYGRDGPEGIAKMWRLLAKKYNTEVPPYAPRRVITRKPKTKKETFGAAAPLMMTAASRVDLVAEAYALSEYLIAQPPTHPSNPRARSLDAMAIVSEAALFGIEGLDKMWYAFAKEYGTEVPPSQVKNRILLSLSDGERSPLRKGEGSRSRGGSPSRETDGDQQRETSRGRGEEQFASIHDEYRQKLRRFFMYYDPRRVDEVDAMLLESPGDAHSGKPKTLTAIDDSSFSRGFGSKSIDSPKSPLFTSPFFGATNRSGGGGGGAGTEQPTSPASVSGRSFVSYTSGKGYKYAVDGEEESSDKSKKNKNHGGSSSNSLSGRLLKARAERGEISRKEAYERSYYEDIVNRLEMRYGPMPSYDQYRTLTVFPEFSTVPEELPVLSLVPRGVPDAINTRNEDLSSPNAVDQQRRNETEHEQTHDHQSVGKTYVSLKRKVFFGGGGGSSPSNTGGGSSEVKRENGESDEERTERERVRADFEKVRAAAREFTRRSDVEFSAPPFSSVLGYQGDDGEVRPLPADWWRRVSEKSSASYTSPSRKLGLSSPTSRGMRQDVAAPQHGNGNGNGNPLVDESLMRVGEEYFAKSSVHRAIEGVNRRAHNTPVSITNTPENSEVERNRRQAQYLSPQATASMRGAFNVGEEPVARHFEHGSNSQLVHYGEKDRKVLLTAEATDEHVSHASLAAVTPEYRPIGAIKMSSSPSEFIHVASHQSIPPQPREASAGASPRIFQLRHSPSNGARRSASQQDRSAAESYPPDSIFTQEQLGTGYGNNVYAAELREGSRFGLHGAAISERENLIARNAGVDYPVGDDGSPFRGLRGAPAATLSLNSGRSNDPINNQDVGSAALAVDTTDGSLLMFEVNSGATQVESNSKTHQPPTPVEVPAAAAVRPPAVSATDEVLNRVRLGRLGEAGAVDLSYARTTSQAPLSPLTPTVSMAKNTVIHAIEGGTRANKEKDLGADTMITEEINSNKRRFAIIVPVIVKLRNAPPIEFLIFRVQEADRLAFFEKVILDIAAAALLDPAQIEIVDVFPPDVFFSLKVLLTEEQARRNPLEGFVTKAMAGTAPMRHATAFAKSQLANAANAATTSAMQIPTITIDTAACFGEFSSKLSSPHSMPPIVESTPSVEVLFEPDPSANARAARLGGLSRQQPHQLHDEMVFSPSQFSPEEVLRMKTADPNAAGRFVVELSTNEGLVHSAARNCKQANKPKQPPAALQLQHSYAPVADVSGIHFHSRSYGDAHNNLSHEQQLPSPSANSLVNNILQPVAQLQPPTGMGVNRPPSTSAPYQNSQLPGPSRSQPSLAHDRGDLLSAMLSEAESTPSQKTNSYSQPIRAPSIKNAPEPQAQAFTARSAVAPAGSHYDPRATDLHVDGGRATPSPSILIARQQSFASTRRLNYAANVPLEGPSAADLKSSEVVPYFTPSQPSPFSGPLNSAAPAVALHNDPRDEIPTTRGSAALFSQPQPQRSESNLYAREPSGSTPKVHVMMHNNPPLRQEQEGAWVPATRTSANITPSASGLHRTPHRAGGAFAQRVDTFGAAATSFPATAVASASRRGSTTVSYSNAHSGAHASEEHPQVLRSDGPTRAFFDGAAPTTATSSVDRGNAVVSHEQSRRAHTYDDRTAPVATTAENRRQAPLQHPAQAVGGVVTSSTPSRSSEPPPFDYEPTLSRSIAHARPAAPSQQEAPHRNAAASIMTDYPRRAPVSSSSSFPNGYNINNSNGALELNSSNGKKSALSPWAMATASSGVRSGGQAAYASSPISQRVGSTSGSLDELASILHGRGNVWRQE